MLVVTLELALGGGHARTLAHRRARDPEPQSSGNGH